MSLGSSLAAALHTFFVIALLIILMPFRLPKKKVWALAGSTVVVLCAVAGTMGMRYGIDFLSRYGYLFIGLPLYFVMYLFSKAKGSRYAFIVLTLLIFHRIVTTLLMVVRVYTGGFTPIYFLMNFLLFGLLLYGAWRMRTDLHKIVFAYGAEFGCLSFFLSILLALIWLFSPIAEYGQVDGDMLLVAVLLYLMTLMLYIYIGISFRSLSTRLDAERNALSLGHQMQAAQEHIKLLQSAQDKIRLYQHDLQHHFLLINEFLGNGKIEELKAYLVQVQQDINMVTPKCYCVNEAANLIFASYTTQAQGLGVSLEIDAQLPESLSMSNTELCTLLSNALENAIAATANVTDGREKTIHLTACLSDGKLLLSVENPYDGTVHIENGLPQRLDKRYGFGTKSMEAIAEKYGGLSSFCAQDGVFTVRLVI